MKKSVLFLLGGWGIGGVERVTSILAEELVRRGWSVTISAFRIDNASMLKELSNEVSVVELAAEGKWFTKETLCKIRKMIEERSVSVVVNCWCVPYRVTRFIRSAIAARPVRLVSVHHNRPDVNGRILCARNLFTRFFFRVMTALNLRLVYDNSDAYVVLSPSYIPAFLKFIHRTNSGRMYAIPNPMILKPVCEKKENVLLYVGRLEETQKRVSRIVDVWRRLYLRHLDWRLVIVGDGPDNGRYRELANGIQRIEFVGFTDPTEWYSRSKILLLTSDYEGFPLVLAESMASGCVPVVLGSYSAVYDIIKDDCGKIVEMPYDVDNFAREVELLMENEELLCDMCVRVRLWTQNFSLKSVVDRYESVLLGCQQYLY